MKHRSLDLVVNLVILVTFVAAIVFVALYCGALCLFLLATAPITLALLAEMVWEICQGALLFLHVLQNRRRPPVIFLENRSLRIEEVHRRTGRL